MDKNNNVLTRIQNEYYQLSASERKIADYVLINYEIVQNMSITQLSLVCGVAEATVSRFCQSLGMKRFSAFKLEIARYVASTIAAINERTISSDSTLARYYNIALPSVHAIQETIDMLNHEDLHKAVVLLEQASRVLCMGSGGSSIMASECAHLFSTVSNKFSAVVDSHIQAATTALLGPNDLLLLFSYSGSTHNGIFLLELAKSRNVPTILITRYVKSPAGQLADIALQCGSNESPMQLGSIPARIAQLTLLDVLFHEFCQRNKDECALNIQKIADVLAEHHL